VPLLAPSPRNESQVEWAQVFCAHRLYITERIFVGTIKLCPRFDKEFAGIEDLFRTVFIVSQVSIEPESAMSAPVQGADLPGLKIQVETASGEKCERCWVRSEKVGQFPDRPTICDRCHSVVG
jgi:isoleucyl-tRNA synthetase